MLNDEDTYSSNWNQGCIRNIMHNFKIFFQASRPRGKICHTYDFGGLPILQKIHI